MKTSLEYALRRGDCFSRSIHFDIHDNFKDLAGIQGSVGSSSAATQGQGSVSASSGYLQASDNAAISNSGNTNITNNVLDPGAIAAGESIALSGLQVASEGLKQAQLTTQQALDQNSKLTEEKVQGPIAGLLKPVGFIAAGLFGIYVLWQVVLAVFSPKKQAA